MLYKSDFMEIKYWWDVLPFNKKLSLFESDRQSRF